MALAGGFANNRLRTKAVAAACAIALCFPTVALPSASADDGADAKAPEQPAASEATVDAGAVGEADAGAGAADADPGAADAGIADAQPPAQDAPAASETAIPQAPAAPETAPTTPAAPATPSTPAAPAAPGATDAVAASPSQSAVSPSAAAQAPQALAPAEAATENEAAPAPDDGKTNGAPEKAAQADAIYALVNRLQAESDKLGAELAEAQRVHGETAAAQRDKHQEYDKATKSLEAQKEEMSDFVVDMYKQGGMTPYYEVLLKSTSYTEFLTSWYMMNEVSLYGRNTIRDQKEAIEALRTEAEALDARAVETEDAMRQAQVKFVRAELRRRALVPHAAALKAEAADMAGDGAGAAQARSELDAANAALEEIRAQAADLDIEIENEGVFTHPCPDAVYSSGFGFRSFDNAFHKGLDMAIGEGTPYVAAESGTVVNATNDGGYNGGAGNWVVIDHGGGLVTKYMHSLVTLVNVGDYVERGQIIGLVGNTGNSFGAHLHFQVEINGTPVDPAIYL